MGSLLLECIFLTNSSRETIDYKIMSLSDFSFHQTLRLEAERPYPIHLDKWAAYLPYRIMPDHHIRLNA